MGGHLHAATLVGLRVAGVAAILMLSSLFALLTPLGDRGSPEWVRLLVSWTIVLSSAAIVGGLVCAAATA